MKIELKEEIIQEFEQFCRLNKIEDILFLFNFYEFYSFFSVVFKVYFF